jgi:hypothetical protein
VIGIQLTKDDSGGLATSNKSREFGIQLTKDDAGGFGYLKQTNHVNLEFN